MRLIDPKQLLREIEVDKYGHIQTTINGLRIAMERSEVETEPVKHGRWIPSDLDKDFMTCSVCTFENRRYRMAYRKDYLKVLHYCPNCGAKMTAEEGE